MNKCNINNYFFIYIMNWLILTTIIIFILIILIYYYSINLNNTLYGTWQLTDNFKKISKLNKGLFMISKYGSYLSITNDNDEVVVDAFTDIKYHKFNFIKGNQSPINFTNIEGVWNLPDTNMVIKLDLTEFKLVLMSNNVIYGTFTKF